MLADTCLSMEDRAHVLRGLVSAGGSTRENDDVMTYRCLSHEFSVRADRPDDAAAVAAALAPFSAELDGDPATTYELRTDSDGAFWLYVDDRSARVSEDPDEPFDLLFWYVGENVVRDERRRLLLHAGAVVTHDGSALLLPGPGGSGKSTTTLGLVGAGMRYLSDEFAVIEPATGCVVPFPRPLALKHGSRRLLPHLDDLAVRTPTDARTTVHVPVERLGGIAATEAAEPGFVVFPTYLEGAVTELTQLTPGQTCIGLLQSTFRMTDRPLEALRVMAGVARRARGYRLTIGDLTEAVDLLSDLTTPSPSKQED